MSRSGELVKVDLLGARYRVGEDRGQYQEDIVHTQDGRGFIVKKCGLYTPVWFELPDGLVFSGRYAAGAFQTFECGLGRVVTLVEESVHDVGFRRVANQIPQVFLPASETAVGPPEGEPAAGQGAGGPARPERENRSPDADVPESKTAPSGPLQETLDLIPRSTLGSNLIKFVYMEPDRTAKLKEVSKHIYKLPDKSLHPKARLLIKRTRLSLDRVNAPLRMIWDRSTSSVKIVDR
jgi:hypothetical protein